MVLPSSFTNLWSKGTEPTANLHPKGHQGGGLVRRYELLSDITIDNSIDTGSPHMFTAGSRFLSRDDVDPRKHLVSFRDIYRHLYRLLYGGSEMRVDNIQGKQENPTFETNLYRTTCEEIHQSLWRHGGMLYGLASIRKNVDRMAVSRGKTNRTRAKSSAETAL